MAKTTTVHSLGRGVGRIRAADPGRRPRPAGLPDLLAGIRPRLAGPLAARRVRAPGQRGRRLPAGPRRARSSTCCRPPSIWPGSEVHLLTRTGREHVLERALEPVLGQVRPHPDRLPPVPRGPHHQRADRRRFAVLIPLQCEALSHRGVGQLLETIEDVRAFANSEPHRPGDHRHHVRRPDQALAPHHRGGRVPLRDTRCSSRRCASRSGSPRHRPEGSRSSSTPRTRQGRWPTASWPAPCSTRASSPAARASARRPRPVGEAGTVLAPGGRGGGGRRRCRRRRGPGPRHPPVQLDPHRRHARPAGKHALFSAATPAGDKEGPAPVASRPAAAEGGVGRGLLHLWLGDPGGPRQLPAAAAPHRHLDSRADFDRRMTCPACRHRTWTSVTLAR